MILTPCNPTKTLIQTNQSKPAYPPIICSNNTMIMISLSQMKQSKGCGRIKNDKIFNLHLGSGAGF